MSTKKTAKEAAASEPRSKPKEQEELEQSLREANGEIRRLKGVIDALLAAREADAEVKRLQDELAVLKLAADEDENEPEAAEPVLGVASTGEVEEGSAESTLTQEEQVQGRNWKELFVSSDVFREHIKPHLGDTWTATLMEACGVARSMPKSSKIESSRVYMSHTDMVASLEVIRFAMSRGAKLRWTHMVKAAEAGAKGGGSRSVRGPLLGPTLAGFSPRADL